MNPRFHLPAIAGALIVVLSAVTACSPAPTPSPSVPTNPSAADDIYPVLISQELTVGENRVLFSFQDASGAPIAKPDRTVSLAFTGPNGATATPDDPQFIWSIENEVGIFVTHATFPAAGDWMATFTTSTPESPEQTIPFSFQVHETASVVANGKPAPSVDTPTLADVGGDVSKISTDTEPDEAFYETSVADALAAKEPFVLVFATPKFCQTKTCGPTLDKVKEVAAKHPDVTFINVEPYLLEDVDGQLQPKLDANRQLQAVPATVDYGLVTEPYVFVVGGDGLVKASFELIFTPDEMDAALEGLS
ncbi:MAG TPA: hypothetical protein VFV72_03105 [Candidatus Limnocylindrales bacterium]|nr:hypothetical protein [Candidatus Limnocylindrales bacterium]